MKIFQIKLWRSFFSFYFFDLHLVSSMISKNSMTALTIVSYTVMNHDSWLVYENVLYDHKNVNDPGRLTRLEFRLGLGYGTAISPERTIMDDFLTEYLNGPVKEVYRL